MDTGYKLAGMPGTTHVAQVEVRDEPQQNVKQNVGAPRTTHTNLQVKYVPIRSFTVVQDGRKKEGRDNNRGIGESKNSPGL